MFERLFAPALLRSSLIDSVVPKAYHRWQRQEGKPAWLARRSPLPFRAAEEHRSRTVREFWRTRRPVRDAELHSVTPSVYRIRRSPLASRTAVCS